MPIINRLPLSGKIRAQRIRGFVTVVKLYKFTFTITITVTVNNG